MGYHSAKEFNIKLLETIEKRQKLIQKKKKTEPLKKQKQLV
jgi:hypothetical protein